jgi:hypothetical protein
MNALALQMAGIAALSVVMLIDPMAWTCNNRPPSDPMAWTCNNKPGQPPAKTKDCSCKPCTCSPCRCALPKDMVKIDCPSCGGIGYYGKFFPCERCDGKGHVWVEPEVAKEKKAKDAAKCCCKDCKCCCCCKGAKK